MAGNFTFDASTSATGSITMTTVSAGGNTSVTLGGGSGSYALTSADIDGSFTLDGTKLWITRNVNLSVSGAVVMTLEGGDREAFSAHFIDTQDSLTITQERAGSGSTSLQNISASGSITINLGTSTEAEMLHCRQSTLLGSLLVVSKMRILILKASTPAALTINNAGEGTLDASGIDSNTQYP